MERINKLLLIAIITITLSTLTNGLTVKALTTKQNQPSNFKVIVRVNGVDSSTGLATIWVTANGITNSKTVDTTSMLDSNDDDDDNIEVYFLFKGDKVKLDDKFQACIKVLDDKDMVGKDFACVESVNESGTMPRVITITL